MSNSKGLVESTADSVLGLIYFIMFGGPVLLLLSIVLLSDTSDLSTFNSDSLVIWEAIFDSPIGLLLAAILLILASSLDSTLETGYFWQIWNILFLFASHTIYSIGMARINYGSGWGFISCLTGIWFGIFVITGLVVLAKILKAYYAWKKEI